MLTRFIYAKTEIGNTPPDHFQTGTKISHTEASD